MKFLSTLTPEPGDLLRVRRKAGYYHYGIAVDNNHVVHFTGAEGDLSKDAGGIMVRETSLNSFLAGDQLYVEKSYYSDFESEVIVERAKNAIGQTTFRGKPYNFVSNNCEHFARFIFNGKATCTQVRNAAKIVGVVGGTVVATIATTALYKAFNKKKNK